MGWIKHLVCIVVIFCLQFWKAGSWSVWPLWGSANAGWWGVVMCREEKGHWKWDISMGIGCCCYCFFSGRDVAAPRWPEQGSTTTMLTLSHLISDYCAHSYLSLACRLSKLKLGRRIEAKAHVVLHFYRWSSVIKLVSQCKDWSDIVILFQLFAFAYW